jgi:hypothetical protein
MLWENSVLFQTALFPQEEARNGMFLNNLSRALSAMMAGVGSVGVAIGVVHLLADNAAMDDAPKSG